MGGGQPGKDGKGGGPPGKGGKGGGPPGKGQVSHIPSSEGGHQTKWNQMKERESAGQTAWATVLPLDTFLERHRRHLGSPVGSPRPYCKSCRRLEVREKWLEKQACSVCGKSLNELPSAYQPDGRGVRGP